MTKLILSLFVASLAFGQSCASIPLGFVLGNNGGRLGGFVPFPTSTYWHRDISGVAADPQSASYIDDIRQGGDRPLRSLYPSTQPNQPVEGFFYYVVDGDVQPRINVFYDEAYGIVHMTAGSPNVTWVSGGTFPDLGSFGSPANFIFSARATGQPYIISPTQTLVVASVTDSHNLILTSNFAGPTGDYSWGPLSIPGESDPGPMPIPIAPVVQGSLVPNVPVPQWNPAANGDGHVVVLDRKSCVLYELYAVQWDGHSLHAQVGAIFDMLGGDNQRPMLWTSGSVSGMPMFPGWLRTEEINGTVPINHPIGVSAFQYRGSGNFFKHHGFILPASHHQYGQSTWGDYWHYYTTAGETPFGSFMRLQPSFNVSSFCGIDTQCSIILNAMKKYGNIIFDGGLTVDIYSAASQAWNAATTAFLFTNFTVQSGTTNFELITTGNSIYCDPLYSQGPTGNTPSSPHSPICPTNTNDFPYSPATAPSITGLVATPTHTPAGAGVTLSWTTTDASSRLRWVTPEIGVVTTDSVVVHPQKTTTYTVRATNFKGETTQTVTVTVP